MACNCKSITLGVTASTRSRTWGFLPFSAGGITCLRFPAIWRGIAGRAITTFAKNLTANYVYQLPCQKVRNAVVARAVNGWQVSGSIFFSQRRTVLGA